MSVIRAVVERDRNHVLDVEDRTHFPAKIRTVFMRDAAVLVDEDSQHAGFAPAAQLHVYNLQAGRGRDPLCYFSNSIDVKCHETSDLLADAQ